MSCGVGHRHGSDPELLWLWHQPAATAPTRPLAWEPSCAVGVAQEKAKTTTTTKNQTNKQKTQPTKQKKKMGKVIQDFNKQDSPKQRKGGQKNSAY